MTKLQPALRASAQGRRGRCGRWPTSSRT